MSEVNTVTLNIASYNQIKAEDQKSILFVDHLLVNANLSADRSKLEFDSDRICLAMSVLYGERYKNKLSALRRRASKGK